VKDLHSFVSKQIHVTEVISSRLVELPRFKDGLSTQGVIYALEQHASVFRPFMCSSVKKLTSATLEDIFEVQLSEKGSTRRQEETRALGFWRDYLLETEGLSLQDISMFATGLNTLPPAGIQPQPNTCANTIKIPMSKTYEQFQKDMDFGIQNSPELCESVHLYSH
uniref:HECT domain-containing protein n=1 Tax=Acanthochromis polyacanthus TaxID=80966 RepID=A0A3Q1G2R9_9TELE